MGDRRRPVLAALGAAVVVALGALGLIRSSGPASTSFGPSDRVVLVSVPGLRWQDLDAVASPHLQSLLSASGLLSVRSIGSETSMLEGYLALGAGNRLETDATDELSDSSATCVPRYAQRATAQADDGLNGAEPGALGSALRTAGRTTAVFGSTTAIVALMASDGCVGTHGGSTEASFEADVTLVELLGLEHTTTAALRADSLRQIDAAVGRLAVPDDATVIVFAPSAPDDAGEVTVVGARDVPPGLGAFSSVISPSTRRAGYVQLTDLGPTVLEVLGIDVPSAMSGTSVAATRLHDDVSQRNHDLADLAERVAFRDRAVGPVSVVLAVLMALCGIMGLARRGRVARMLAPVVVAYPTVTFLMGLVPYHHLPLDFVVVAVAVVSAFVAALVTGWTARWGPWAGVTVLAAALWLTLTIDIVTGGSLQINTPLGYSPTIAGRFQGFGNLSFGLVAAAAIVVALAAMSWPRLRVPALGWAAWVGAITVIADAAPAFGSDVGGTLALVPAFAVLLTIMAGRRIRAGRVALVGVATFVAVALLAVLDHSRAPSSRTHLGRFLDDLLNGRGGLIIRRKLHGNLAILTSSFWSIVLVVVLAGLVVLAWQRRQVVQRMVEGRPEVRAFLAGFAVVAVLGFALNDSGLAVPAIMLDVAIPWLVATMVPVVRRAGR